MRAILTILMVAGAVACQKPAVTHYQARKQAPSAGPSEAMTSMAPMARPQGEELPPPPKPEAGIKWNLPKGWSQTEGSGMRYATIKAPVSGKVDVSVIVLPGDAGGELANVNRWRGQLGLAPIDDATLAAQRTALKTKAGDVSVYDFTTDGANKSRMIAALTTVNGSTWFIKMTGDATPVGAASAGFLQLLKSLHAN